MQSLFKLRTESVSEQYMNEMHDSFHCFASWLPGIPLQIGDIGELKHNEFTYVSNLQNKGIPFTVRTDPSPGVLEHRSGGNVTMETKQVGEAAIPQFNLYYGDAGVIIRFGSKKGIVFEATGVKHLFIEDISSVDTAIAEAHKRGKWKDRWVVISDLVIADSATILIAQGKGATVALKAKSDVTNVSLANLDANFEMTYADNMNTAILCQAGLAPLFKVRGIIKKHWFSDQFEAGGRKGPGRTFSITGEPSHTGSSRPIVGEIEFKPFG
jgi:hypothetical protein